MVLLVGREKWLKSLKAVKVKTPSLREFRTELVSFPYVVMELIKFHCIRKADKPTVYR